MAEFGIAFKWADGKPWEAVKRIRPSLIFDDWGGISYYPKELEVKVLAPNGGLMRLEVKRRSLEGETSAV